MGWTQSFTSKSVYERTQFAAFIREQRINLENIFADDDHDGVLRASVIKKKSQRKKSPSASPPMPANVGWSKIPIWMQHNMYIRTGYRPPLGQHGRCVASLFYMHNETGKIMMGVWIVCYWAKCVDAIDPTSQFLDSFCGTGDLCGDCHQGHVEQLSRLGP